MRTLICVLLIVLAIHAEVGRADEPRTAEDVIARYVDALGGRDKLAARKTVRLTGKVTMPGDLEAQFLQESKRPDRFRTEIAMVQGDRTVRMVYAFDGKVWWQITPMFGQTEPQELPPDLAKAFAEQADVDGPLVDAREKGHKVELVGREELDGKPVYKLKLILKGAAEDEYDYCFIDAQSWLLIRVTGQRTVMGMTTTFEKNRSDYRRAGDVLVPYTERTVASPGDAVYLGRIEKVETNIDLPDERFSLAAAKQAAATSSAPATQEARPGPVPNEPAARELYDRMIAALRAANSLSFESRYQLQLGALPGATCSYKAWLKKPNYFRVEAADMNGKVAGVLIGDGENLWIHWPRGRPQFNTPGGAAAEPEYEATRYKVYMTKPAPPQAHSIGHEIGLLGAGILMNILDLSTFHGYTDSLQPLIDGVARHGTETVAGEACDVLNLSFMDGQRVWRLWISQRDFLPRKLTETVYVAADIHAEEIWSNIRLNEAIAAEQFVWKPPDDWKQWHLPESEQALLKAGTPAPDFALKLTDGQTTRLSDYRGKMVWLVFWRAG